MNADQLDSLTERVLGAVFEVTNTLGAGFLEKVYQRALLRELGLRGIRAVAEASFTVTYKGHSAGEYFADLLVEDVLDWGFGATSTTAPDPECTPLAALKSASEPRPSEAVKKCSSQAKAPAPPPASRLLAKVGQALSPANSGCWQFSHSFSGSVGTILRRHSNWGRYRQPTRVCAPG